VNAGIVLQIARLELVVTIRNRWTAIFAVVFGALVVTIALIGVMAEGFSGFQSFTRTTASLLNLVLYIVPLVALTMGTLSFTGDRGAMELLFSQPVGRSDVVFGKLAGLLGSMALSTVAGFLLAGGVILAGSGPEGLWRYLLFVALSLALSLVFLALALAAATLSKRKPRAFGLALFLWFFFVLFYDLLALGVTLLLSGSAATTFLFLSLFGNPVDMVRVATLILLDNTAIFGAAGAALLRFLGGQTLSVLLLTGGLLLWVLGPLLLSHRLLCRQDI
jgi:Cu-processing system permease protein